MQKLSTPIPHCLNTLIDYLLPSIIAFIVTEIALLALDLKD